MSFNLAIINFGEFGIHVHCQIKNLPIELNTYVYMVYYTDDQPFQAL